MPRPDLAAARALCLGRRQLDCAACVRRKSLRNGNVRLAAPQCADDERARCFLLRAECVQRAPRRALLLAQQPQQQMLAADIAVSQLKRRRLRAAQHPLGPCAESPLLQGDPPFCPFYLTFSSFPTFSENKPRNRTQKIQHFPQFSLLHFRVLML